MERHEGHHEIGTAGADREPRRVGDDRRLAGLVGGAGPGHGRRAVEGDHPMAPGDEVSPDPPLPRADVECQPPGRRHQFEEPGAVEPPVGVVLRLPRPPEPVSGVLVPRVPKRHVASITDTAAPGRRVGSGPCR